MESEFSVLGDAGKFQKNAVHGCQKEKKNKKQSSYLKLPKQETTKNRFNFFL
jgi:hypothetical protein